MGRCVSNSAAASAAINREPGLIRVINVGAAGTPISKPRLAAGDLNEADYIATVAAETIKSCPDGGRSVVLILGDTASGEQLAGLEDIVQLLPADDGSRRKPPASGPPPTVSPAQSHSRPSRPRQAPGKIREKRKVLRSGENT